MIIIKKLMLSKKEIIIFMFILIICALLRGQFLNGPFESDEGGYAYIGKEIFNGKTLYVDIWDNKPPLIFYLYGFILLLQKNIVSIKVITILFVLLETVLIFLIGKNIFNKRIAFISSFLFAIFSGTPLMQGDGSNVEVFLNLFLLFSFYFFIEYINKKENKYLIYTGLALGVGFMFKQVALFNFIAILILLFFINKEEIIFPIKKLSYVVISFLSPTIFFLIYSFVKKSLREFIFAIFIYNISYIASSEDFYYRAIHNTLLIMLENYILWFLGLIAVLLILFKNRTIKNNSILLYTLFTLFGVIVGGKFFPHYYITLIPPLSLLSAYSLNYFLKLKNKKVKYFIWIIIIIMFIDIVNFEYKIFSLNKEDLFLLKYKRTDFLTSINVSRYIQENSANDDLIYVWGPNPEIYLYSKRKASTKYIFYLPLYKEFTKTPEFTKKIRTETISQIKKDRPKYIIVTKGFNEFNELEEMVNEKYTLERYFPYKVLGEEDSLFLIYKRI